CDVRRPDSAAAPENLSTVISPGRNPVGESLWRYLAEDPVGRRPLADVRIGAERPRPGSPENRQSLSRDFDICMHDHHGVCATLSELEKPARVYAVERDESAGLSY